MAYAKKFEGHTLREVCELNGIADPHVRKGSFGNAIENSFFHYASNSDPDADFKQVGTELKTTPLKVRADGSYAAKERLVIQMIDYLRVVDETWETSSLQHKLRRILLIAYLYDKTVDPVDYLIKLVELWGVPPEDVPVFKHDWETVVNKVRAGRAHEISGADTFYLEAATKAANGAKRRPQPYADIPAKPRAWAIKQSYMTTVFSAMLDAQAIRRRLSEAELGLAELVRERFSAYVGMTERELAEQFGLLTSSGRAPKHHCALITKRVLGIREEAKIAEFEKAGIKTKTIRLKRNGVPKESISFPVFSYLDLAERPFEASEFLGYLQQTYLFVIYAESVAEPGVFRMERVLFWRMPESDLDAARACYEEMQRRVRSGCAERSVTSTENRCCYVRPHARDKQDTNPTPYGSHETKKCFWLNARYVAAEIDRVERHERWVARAVQEGGLGSDRGDVAEREIRVAELFAGVGGFRLGLDGHRDASNPGFDLPAAGPYRTIWANQWEPPGTPKKQFAAACYQQRFGADSLINEDINQVLDAYEAGRVAIPDVDMVVGGFPCQDYSVAKPLSQASGIAGKKGVLWWDIYRFLHLKAPRYVLLENVDRLLKSPASQRGRDFAIILSCFASLGYAVEWRVINAADYGFPQKRRRTYIYAEKTDASWDLEARLYEGVMADAFPIERAAATARLEVSLDPYASSQAFGVGLKKSPFENAGLMQGGCVLTAKVKPLYAGPQQTLGDVLVPDAEVPEDFWVDDAEKLERWRYFKGGKSEPRVDKRTGFAYRYSEGSMAFPDACDAPSRTILTSEGGGVGLPDETHRAGIGRAVPSAGSRRARPAAGLSEGLDGHGHDRYPACLLHGQRPRGGRGPSHRRGPRTTDGVASAFHDRWVFSLDMT